MYVMLIFINFIWYLFRCLFGIFACIDYTFGQEDHQLSPPTALTDHIATNSGQSAGQFYIFQKKIVISAVTSEKIIRPI